MRQGGVLIAWDQDLILAEAPIKKTYSISLKLTLRLSNTVFWLTAVYGPTEDREKASFLNELMSCQPATSIPWLCIGDFNLICDASDKNNCNINRRQMREFRCALDASELLEIRLVNRKYTWSNGRSRPTLVHLDRAFCNQAWDSIFPPLSLLALSSSLSDHCPCSFATTTCPRERQFSVLSISGPAPLIS